MQDTSRFTAMIISEGSGYFAHCPELGVVSQGATPMQARSSLAAAVGLFLETASLAEIAARRREVVVEVVEPERG